MYTKKGRVRNPNLLKVTVTLNKKLVTYCDKKARKKEISRSQFIRDVLSREKRLRG